MTQVNMGTETCDGVNEKCTSDPNFAVICAFLAEFGQHPSIVGQQACGKDDKRLPDIGQLQNLIEKSEESVDDELIKFHVKVSLYKKVLKKPHTCFAYFWCTKFLFEFFPLQGKAIFFNLTMN